MTQNGHTDSEKRPLIIDHKAAVADLWRFIAGIDPVRHAQEFPHKPRRPETHWPACRHKHYHLTCPEFEMLFAESGGFCDICHSDQRTPGGRNMLHIDHDHNLGWRAVRGLLCGPCNNALGIVDSGREPDRNQANYLRDPWHARVGLSELGCPAPCVLADHLVDRPAKMPIKPARWAQAQQRKAFLAQL